MEYSSGFGTCGEHGGYIAGLYRDGRSKIDGISSIKCCQLLSTVAVNVAAVSSTVLTYTL